MARLVGTRVSLSDQHLEVMRGEKLRQNYEKFLDIVYFTVRIMYADYTIYYSLVIRWDEFKLNKCVFLFQVRIFPLLASPHNKYCKCTDDTTHFSVWSYVMSIFDQKIISNIKWNFTGEIYSQIFLSIFTRQRSYWSFTDWMEVLNKLNIKSLFSARNKVAAGRR